MTEEKITVRKLINILLDQPMDAEVIAKKNGKRIRNVSLCTVEDHSKGLGALFG